MQQQSNEQTAEQTAEQKPEFFFTYEADANGVKKIEFVTDGPLVMQSILLMLEQVNESFEQKFPAVSGFLQELTNVARNIEEIKNGKEA